MNSTPFVIPGLGELSPEEQELAAKANELFHEICNEEGIRVSNWMDFPAWKSYVRGDMEDSELEEQAKIEIEDRAGTFGKYLVIKEEEPSSVLDPAERERARRANSIYRKICKDMGLTLCFFHDFSTWSDYVKGRIDEAEFYKRAKAEAEKMADKAKSA